MERMYDIFHKEDLLDTGNGRNYTYDKVARVVSTGNQDGAQAAAQ